MSEYEARAKIIELERREPDKVTRIALVNVALNYQNPSDEAAAILRE